jgi:hypothetical protein
LGKDATVGASANPRRRPAIGPSRFLRARLRRHPFTGGAAGGGRERGHQAAETLGAKQRKGLERRRLIIVLHATAARGRRHWEIGMADYILLMHDDAKDDEDARETYIHGLKQGGFFQGGSAIGGGVCARKDGTPPSVTAHLTGYIRLNADSLDQAKSLLIGNPHFEAGGTVEIRELPRTD